MDIKNLRENYDFSLIDFNKIDKDPINFFKKWFKEAVENEPFEANAFVLSTVDQNHFPHSRVVLLKDIDKNNFIFFSNYSSNKGREINSNYNVAMNFHWPKLQRQVRIEGIVNKISSKESDKYFYQRPIESQIGAIISPQSTKISFDYDFKKEFKKNTSNTLERPINWGGYFISANKIEFWQGRPSRLHDRLLYELINNNWTCHRLAP